MVQQIQNVCIYIIMDNCLSHITHGPVPMSVFRKREPGAPPPLRLKDSAEGRSDLTGDMTKTGISSIRITSSKKSTCIKQKKSQNISCSGIRCH